METASESLLELTILLAQSNVELTTVVGLKSGYLFTGQNNKILTLLFYYFVTFSSDYFLPEEESFDSKICAINVCFIRPVNKYRDFTPTTVDNSVKIEVTTIRMKIYCLI